MRYTQEYRYRRIARWFDRQAAKLAAARVAKACAAGELWKSKYRIHE